MYASLSDLSVPVRHRVADENWNRRLRRPAGAQGSQAGTESLRQRAQHEDEELEKKSWRAEGLRIRREPYKIAVAPKQELTFHLVFHPSEASGAETFALPMLLEGVARQPIPSACANRCRAAASSLGSEL